MPLEIVATESDSYFKADWQKKKKKRQAENRRLLYSV